MKNIFRITFISLAFFLSACSIQAPPYQASLDNVQTIKRAKIQQIEVGTIESSEDLNSISLRGSTMSSPVDKSYGAYISQALEDELKLAKLWTPASATIISGEILTNDIDVSGFSTGTGEASAKFIVTRDNTIVFDKVIAANHQFDSSFLGSIAIPNGQSNYVNLVQKLIKNLFEDEEFITVLKK